MNNELLRQMHAAKTAFQKNSEIGLSEAEEEPQKDETEQPAADAKPLEEGKKDK